jgi:hypothetical protein
LSIHGHRFTFKHLCWHSITKILRNGPRAHFPFSPREERLRNSPASGNFSAIIRLLRANGHLQAHLMRARSAQKSGMCASVHRTIYSTCPVYIGQPGGPRSQKLQRSPDCPVHHTCNTQFVNNLKRVDLTMCFCPILIVTWK